MLDRFRDLVKRLELPDNEEPDVVYRILDDDFNILEVTPSQYTNWRLQHDVTQKAMVGQDTVENVMVRTTFSIMPEGRNYKPFGSHAYAMPAYDPLLEYSRRYDTWREAEWGHRETLERIRRDAAAARAAEERAAALAGTAGQVAHAIASDLPAMFQVIARSEHDVTVATPLLRASGAAIELAVSAGRAGFTLTAALDGSPGDANSMLEAPGAGEVDALCEALGVSVEPGALVCRAEDASQLGRAIVSLAQAVACVSFLARESR